MTVNFEESDRQAILLALARLSVARPGWHYMLGEIAEKLSGREMFEQFRTYAGPPPGWPEDAGNRFEIVRQGDMVVALNLNPEHGQFVFTIGEAIELAAWAAKLADPNLKEFHRLVTQIEKP